MSEKVGLGHWQKTSAAPGTEPGLPVAGYKPQSAGAIAQVNRNKELEERILRLLDGAATDPETDKRWLALARTQIEQGFMALNRAVFKPCRVVLPEDGD
jgi:cytochrome c-type biogenesis protein CcmH/NrfG